MCRWLAREQDLSANFFFVYPDNGLTYCFGVGADYRLSRAVKGGELNPQQNSYHLRAFLLLSTSLLPLVVVFAFVLNLHSY